MTLEEKLSMLRQMRWHAAKHATGDRADICTAEMIHAHQAILAIQAVIAEGEPTSELPGTIHHQAADATPHWSKLR